MSLIYHVGTKLMSRRDQVRVREWVILHEPTPTEIQQKLLMYTEVVYLYFDNFQKFLPRLHLRFSPRGFYET